MRFREIRPLIAGENMNIRLEKLQIATIRICRVTLSILLVLVLSCEINESPELKADAGPDQTLQVGMYAILDGSGSTFGDNTVEMNWRWEPDENNPHHYYHFDPIAEYGFVEEGVYNFYLTVNDGDETSEPDTVTITVEPRQQVLFEDPALEVALRYTLRSPTITITEELLQSVDSLVWASNMRDKIQTLKGLEKCTHLRYLGLLFQEFSSIEETRSLSDLETLDLYDDLIQDITPLKNLTNLKRLNLMENQISDISSLKNLHNLEYLDLTDNPLSDVSPLSDLINLRELYFSRVDIYDISPLAKLTNLEVLWLANCSVPDISSLASLTHLKLLNVRVNGITDISVLGGLTQLVRLYLSDNSIQDISSLSGLYDLEFIDLGHNQITDIQPLIQNEGIAKNDLLILNRNPLSEISEQEYMPLLLERGVLIIYF